MTTPTMARIFREISSPLQISVLSLISSNLSIKHTILTPQADQTVIVKGEDDHSLSLDSPHIRVPLGLPFSSDIWTTGLGKFPYYYIYKGFINAWFSERNVSELVSGSLLNVLKISFCLADKVEAQLSGFVLLAYP